MEWLDRLNDVVAYVEGHLTGETTIEKAAQRGACLVYHFQRMFPYITGVTFSEHVRCRRMTAAAMELTAGGARVINGTDISPPQPVEGARPRRRA